MADNVKKPIFGIFGVFLGIVGFLLEKYLSFFHFLILYDKVYIHRKFRLDIFNNKDFITDKIFMVSQKSTFLQKYSFNCKNQKKYKLDFFHLNYIA